MSWGIKASKPGQDVKIADVKDLYLDTTYPLLKIKQYGTGTLSITDGGSDSDVITHNLGFIPKVLVYGQYYNIYINAKESDYGQYPIQQQVAGANYSSFVFTVNSTQLTITGAFTDGTSNSVTTDYFYYIFYDEE